MNKKCKFCAKLVKDVDERYFVHKETGEAICYNCGWSEDQKESPQSSERIALNPAPKEEFKDILLQPFYAILPYIREWRKHQIQSNKLTTKFMSNFNLSDEILVLEKGLESVKIAYLAGKKYDASILLLDLITHGVAYFEANPTSLENE